MTAQLIDGKAIAQGLRTQVLAGVMRLPRAPKLAVILIGDLEPSRIYVRNKLRAASEAGIRAELHEYPATITQADLLQQIARLNRDASVDAILLQLPLPFHIDRLAALATIDPAKDVDGLTPASQGWLAAGCPTGQTGFLPCTPKGCMMLVESVQPDPAGLEAVVIGRSQLVGQPLALLLLQRGATVTVTHSATRDLSAHTHRADIICLAAGVPALLTGDMVKPDAIVIDVGINRVEGRLTGDADFASVAAVASAITPVPGGVGPMTIACLLDNTLQAAERNLSIRPAP